MPPIPSARSSVRARLKRTLLFPRASPALSKPLQKQRIPHPLIPTKFLHHLQILQPIQQISPARSPSPHPAVPIPYLRADKRPRTPGPVAHSQTPPPKAFLLTLPPPVHPIAPPPRTAFRTPPPKPSRESNPPAPL